MVENTVDIVSDGDVLLGLSGLAGVKKPISLRASRHVLAMTSPVFKAVLASQESNKPFGSLATSTASPLHSSHQADDGDTMLLLCNILHLRNDKLPSRLPTESLYKLAVLAEKYKCAVAVSRAAAGWFDRLFSGSTTQVYIDMCMITEAALLLDEPTYFARFTERWIKAEPFGNDFAVPPSADTRMKSLSVELRKRRASALSDLRDDIDLLADPCSLAFSKTTEHYIDYAPGIVPDADDDGRIGSICHVGSGAGTTYLGALRDEHIWPALVWPATLGAIIEAIKDFRLPEYDDCDRCDSCEDVKMDFERAVLVVKMMQAVRLWGLCLDCFKAGGLNAGECRYEHSKLEA
ncbi:hypothetical protein LTR36_008262 [Oleoguttula mirabilis]|uniref:BTB domain-containing protein n=1 Tax=Oleoguttula mirabilis TaxID=1507867 RepID=A0AAV9J8S7_9PEZI|nr:hypothetical protein LTR36_008262 [Oleoguttula mirabilis]